MTHFANSVGVSSFEGYCDRKAKCLSDGDEIEYGLRRASHKILLVSRVIVLVRSDRVCNDLVFGQRRLGVKRYVLVRLLRQ